MGENSNSSRILSILTNPAVRDGLLQILASPSGTNTTVAPSPNRNPSEELRRLFRPGQYSGKKNSKSHRQSHSVEFVKEVILLKDPEWTKSLTGKLKAQAYKEGFAKSAIKFNKSDNEYEIKNKIRQEFKILENIDFQLLIPMSGELVEPQLGTDSHLNGALVIKLFYQKSVYIRPLILLDCEDVDQLDIGADSFYGNEFATNDVQETEEIIVIEMGAGNTTGNNLTSFEKPEINVSTEIPTDESIALEDNGTNGTSDEQGITLRDVLEPLSAKIDDDGLTYINIYRGDVFGCCIRALDRKKFCPFNRISVKFSDIEGTAEGAVDLGGPTREMFRLVIEHLQNSYLFHGEEKKFITLNFDALEKREYFFAGRLIGLSLIHGGPGPYFFSDTLYSVISSSLSNTKPSIEDLDQEIKEKLITFIELDDEKLDEFLVDEPIFQIAGSQILKEPSDKIKIYENVLEFYVLHRTRPALDQLTDGLSVDGILPLVKSFPEQFKEVFCGKQRDVRLTAEDLDKLFCVKFSDIGSNKRSVENKIISFWRDFLIECEENNDNSMELGQILIFASGLSRIPPLGFTPCPKITFIHSEDRYPTANTCSVELRLPTIQLNYNEFKNNMIFAFSNCNDFGFA